MDIKKRPKIFSKAFEVSFFYKPIKLPQLRLILLFLGSVLFLEASAEQPVISENAPYEIELPGVVVEGIPVSVNILANDSVKQAEFIVNGETKILHFRHGKASFEVTFEREEPLSIRNGDFVFVQSRKPIPLWLSIIPPLLAIFMALAFKEVISSLFLGIFVGAAIIGYYSGGWLGIFTGFFDVVAVFVMNALVDWSHMAVIVFSVLIGGLVAVVSKNGGMQGIVNRISKFASTAKSGQLATYFLGIGIFFDDYANTLIVGNAMRSTTDSLRISREKLSYLVDSTAAPIAAIAFVTTWIGAELGYIQDGLELINRNETLVTDGAYSVFLSSIQYAFYPVFTLAFMLFLILQNRDFGPMYKAESRARLTGNVEENALSGSDQNDPELEVFNPVNEKKCRAYNGIIPIVVVVAGTITGLFITGWDADIWADPALGFGRKISAVIGNSDSYTSLLWASLLALVVAIALTVSQKILSLGKTIETTITGFKTMMGAVIILVLAWSLASVTEAMHTADFLTGIFSDAIAPWLIATLTFILGAVVAFSTGSSWGTMAILYPLMLPLAWKICQENGMSLEETLMIFHQVVASVLAGSVLGDHCSPISDTTILSSLASRCNHISHVRTQLPYALTAGTLAIGVGLLPSGFGVPVWITMPAGIILAYLVVKYVGRPVPAIPAHANRN